MPTLRVTITTKAKLAALPAACATSSHAASPAKRRASVGASCAARTCVDRSVRATAQWWQTVHLPPHRRELPQAEARRRPSGRRAVAPPLVQHPEGEGGHLL